MDEDIAEVLTRGPDFAMMNDTMLMMCKSVYTTLPKPPVATAAPLSRAVVAARAGAEDRVSRLPAGILRDIVSRLPARDAARTTVLSTRWRRVWHATPLVLVDAHLAPPRAAAARSRAGLLLHMLAPPHDLTAAVSAALDAHPGPFRCIYLLGTAMATRQDEMGLWLKHLVAKGVQELVFVNRATTLDTDVPLPATIFRCTYLTKLYIGFWLFPETATLPRTAGFPYLRELGLGSLIIKERDLAFLLDRCPVLEKLRIIGSRWPVILRVRSQSLRCVEVCETLVPEITVVHASRLERLLMWEAWGGGDLTNMSSRIKIGHAPMLRILGFLVPGMHELEIGNTVIKAGTKASPNTIVPSVQMLALHVKLGTRIEARMVPSFLRCFPNVQTLYVQSENDDIKFWGPEPSGTDKLDLKFWEEVGPIECVQRRIKKVVLREFRGKRSELEFLKFIAEQAQVLEKMVIVFTHGYSPSDEVGVKLTTFMASAKWANACCEVTLFQTPFKQEGTSWCYLRAFDLTCQDPFDVSKCLDGKCQSH